jgi:hypothetical protein
MVSTSEFIKCVVVDILNRDLTSKDYIKFGGSPNIIRRCFERNKGIGPGVVEVISNSILHDTKFDVMKKNLILDYLRQFLNNREKEYLNRNENDIKTIMNFVAKKFNDRLKKTKHTDTFNYNGEKAQYKIVDIATLQKMGWSIRDYVKKSTLLSYEVYDELTDEHVTEFEKSVKVVAEQPENRRILLDENDEMIGMWSFKPFYSDIFEKAKKGNLYDSEIRPTMMPTLLPGGIYNVYFSNIVLKEKYRKSKVFGILFDSILTLLEEWAQQDIFIKEICAQAYSDSGINLCKTLGLKFIKKHVDHGEIYCSYVYDLTETRFCNRFKNLRILYKEFKEKHTETIYNDKEK